MNAIFFSLVAGADLKSWYTLCRKTQPHTKDQKKRKREEEEIEEINAQNPG